MALVVEIEVRGTRKGMNEQSIDPAVPVRDLLLLVVALQHGSACCPVARKIRA